MPRSTLCVVIELRGATNTFAPTGTALLNTACICKPWRSIFASRECPLPNFAIQLSACIEVGWDITPLPVLSTWTLDACGVGSLSSHYGYGYPLANACASFASCP